MNSLHRSAFSPRGVTGRPQARRTLALPASAASCCVLLLLGSCRPMGQGSALTAGITATPDISVARPEALSLLGQPLYAPALPAARHAVLQAQLDSALRALRDRPEDVNAIIWVGRRLGYLGRYREAIEVFTRGLQLHPDEPRLLRHRGHRYITTRQLERAIADLSRAAELVRGQPDEIEPDGQPNALGIPTSTLHGNIHYHLALAHYLRHDFQRALPVWVQARATATTDDMRVAASDWLYMTYRRLGRERDAAAVLEPIHSGMRIIENDAYYRRLLMYKAELMPDALLSEESDDPVQLATYGYGVGNWYLYSGDSARARTIFRRILDNPNWAAFGFIAAEAELARQ